MKRVQISPRMKARTWAVAMSRARASTAWGRCHIAAHSYAAGPTVRAKVGNAAPGFDLETIWREVRTSRAVWTSTIAARFFAHDRKDQTPTGGRVNCRWFRSPATNHQCGNQALMEFSHGRLRNPWQGPPALRRNGEAHGRVVRGRRCQNWPVSGRTRCRLHGGLSTGPKTPEGRQLASPPGRRDGVGVIPLGATPSGGASPMRLSGRPVL